MPVRKWTRAGSVAAAVTAMTLAGIAPAQAGDKPPPSAPGGPAVVAPDQVPGASRAVAAPPGSDAALAAIQARIAAQVAKKGNTYTFGSYLDGTTGRIVVETNAPAAVVSAIVAPPSANAAARTAAVQPVVRATAIKDSARLNDTQPFYGGGGITVAGAGTCSSGYTVYSSVAGYYMVTAGHCYAVGAAVYTETGGLYYGNASNRNLDSITHDGKDLELIGNQTYAGRIFVGTTTSSTSKAVVGAGSASVGVSTYCFSGRTSGESCGHTVTSLNAQVCTTTGCKSPVISYTGGTISQPGDSGAPFYINSGTGVSIRGHVIAGSTSTGYVEPWTVLAGTYAVSIVTG